MSKRIITIDFIDNKGQHGSVGGPPDQMVAIYRMAGFEGRTITSVRGRATSVAIFRRELRIRASR